METKVIKMGLSEEYKKEQNKFVKDTENTNLPLELKLELLKKLADKIGNSKSNSRNFEETMLLPIKFKDPALYEAYQESLKEAFAEAA